MIFKDIFDELLLNDHIRGQLIGGRNEMSAVFVPEYYTKAQQKYIESLF